VIDVSKLVRVAERERREDELFERPNGRKLTQFELTRGSGQAVAVFFSAVSAFQYTLVLKCGFVKEGPMGPAHIWWGTT